MRSISDVNRKHFMLMLGAVLAAVLLAFAFHTDAWAAKKNTCTVYSGENVNDQNYSTYGSTVESYLASCSDGTLMRVQAGTDADGILVQYYDTSYNLLKTVNVAEELPIFGAFYESDSNYYLLTGQKNADESDEVEVFRLTQYDKSWNRICSCSLYGANTYIPFDAGSARMTECGQYLLIRTCHEMYESSDGYHHQANVTIEVDTESMSITDYCTNVSFYKYGYASHSFNQFIQSEDNEIVSIDHGDAYPRAIMLNKTTLEATSSSDREEIDVIEFDGETGDNYTGASVGGFEISSSSYLIAGNQDISDNYKEGRNVFVASVDKETSAVTIHWITANEANTSATCSTPHLVALGTDSYMLLWTYGGEVYYTKIDGSGNQVGSIYSMTGDLSDCVPIVVGSNLIWYTWDDETTVFYSISLSDLSQYSSTEIVDGHTCVYGEVSDGVVSITCSDCDYTSSMGVVTSFYLMGSWGSAASSGAYYYYLPSSIDEGTDIPYWFNPTSVGNSTVTTNNTAAVVTSSDESVIQVVPDSGTTKYGTLKVLKAGTATITAYPKYNPTLTKSYTITVNHVWDDGVVTKEAGIGVDGEKVYTCSVCGETKTEVLERIRPDISTYTVKLSYTKTTYNGNYKKPTPTVTSDDGTVLKKGTDYTVAYSNNKNAGTATVTITGIGNYTGTLTTTFTIKAQTNISTCTAKLNWTKTTYTGSKKCPGVTVKTAGGTTLKKGTNYKVSYSDNVEAGIATVTITGIGKYTGTITKTFTIRPVKPTNVSATAKKTSVKVTFDRHNSADKYYIYVNGKYTGCTKTKSYYTVKGLTTGTTYTVSVKAVKEVDGKKVYSLMSSSVSVTTKK